MAEEGKFLAIVLRQSKSGAQGKLLVGSRGTFTYVLQPCGIHDQGDISDRLIIFPDETARNHFAEASWSPLLNVDNADTCADV